MSAKRWCNACRGYAAGCGHSLREQGLVVPAEPPPAAPPPATPASPAVIERARDLGRELGWDEENNGEAFMLLESALESFARASVEAAVEPWREALAHHTELLGQHTPLRSDCDACALLDTTKEPT